MNIAYKTFEQANQITINHEDIQKNKKKPTNRTKSYTHKYKQKKSEVVNMKLATHSFVLKKGDETIPFEELSKEEQEQFGKKFAEDFMDSIMRARGYQRKEETSA